VGCDVQHEPSQSNHRPNHYLAVCDIWRIFIIHCNRTVWRFSCGRNSGDDMQTPAYYANNRTCRLCRRKCVTLVAMYIFLSGDLDHHRTPEPLCQNGRSISPLVFAQYTVVTNHNCSVRTIRTLRSEKSSGTLRNIIINYGHEDLWNFTNFTFL